MLQRLFPYYCKGPTCGLAPRFARREQPATAMASWEAKQDPRRGWTDGPLTELGGSHQGRKAVEPFGGREKVPTSRMQHGLPEALKTDPKRHKIKGSKLICFLGLSKKKK